MTLSFIACFHGEKTITRSIGLLFFTNLFFLPLWGRIFGWW